MCLIEINFTAFCSTLEETVILSCFSINMDKSMCKDLVDGKPSEILNIIIFRIVFTHLISISEVFMR